MDKILSIVIPVYNEELNISKVLNCIKNKIQTPSEIFIIYDFDEDNTLAAARDWMKNNDESKIYFVKNKKSGVLEAIKTGLCASNSPYILVTMADLADNLSDVDKMVAKAKEDYDIVCGSRYMKGGKQIGGPLIKRTLSRLAGLSLFYITNIPTHDATNSFKLYSKKVLDEIDIESNGGFELGIEITAKAYLKGYKITEIPTTWKDRTEGKSRFKFFSWLPKYLKWYFLALSSLFKKNIDKTHLY